MRLIIHARIVELYDRHGLEAFGLPGVQQSIDLLLNADPRTRLNQAQLAAIYRAWRESRRAGNALHKSNF